MRRVKSISEARRVFEQNPPSITCEVGEKCYVAENLESAEKFFIRNGMGEDCEEKQEDPWEHRSENMRCSSCMWYAPKMGGIGRCRRHCPTMNGYPVVMESDWCGDHKLDETKQ
jgi:hypothetical protein